MAKKVSKTKLFSGKAHDMAAMEPIHKAMHLKMLADMNLKKARANKK